MLSKIALWLVIMLLLVALSSVHLLDGTSPIWDRPEDTEALEYGSEATRNATIDRLLEELRAAGDDWDEGQAWAITGVFVSARLPSSARSRILAEYARLIPNDAAHPLVSPFLWCADEMSSDAKPALPALHRIAGAAPPPDPGDVERDDEAATIARDLIDRIERGEESPGVNERVSLHRFVMRSALVLTPFVGAAIAFWRAKRRRTGETEEDRRRYWRWRGLSSALLWISAVGLPLTFLSPRVDDSSWPLALAGAFAGLVALDFLFTAFLCHLDGKWRGLKGSGWKNSLPQIWLLLHGLPTLAGFAFLAVGLLSIGEDAALNPRWIPIAAFAVFIAGWLIWPGPLRRALGFLEAPATEKLRSVASRHEGRFSSVTILPAYDSRFANAFAMPGKSLVFTDCIVDACDEAELDGIFCHELGHLERPAEARWRKVFATSIPIVLVASASILPWCYSWLGPVRAVHSLLPHGCAVAAIAAFLAIGVAYQRMSRRWEVHADSYAIEHCRDPEALARALVKVHDLLELPREFHPDGRETETHPSLRRRLAAIYEHPRLEGKANPYDESSRERDPRRVSLELHPEKLAIVLLPADAETPPWAENGAFTSVTRTSRELSIVCSANLVPRELQSEREWRRFEIAGDLDFDEIGILASLTEPLADGGVSVFAVSTFRTDSILVPAADVDRAAELLTAAGHRVEASTDSGDVAATSSSSGRTRD